jgi:Spy/CpxP family protein refolding chaperone
MSVKQFVMAALICCSMAPAAVMAQRERKTPEERANMQTEWMKKNLSISPEQSIKVHDIILVHARTMENAPRGDRRELMKTEMASRDAELRNVLTADQYARYQQHEEEMRQKMQERREARGQ